MKLVERSDKRIVFYLRAKEHMVLLTVLAHYPLLNSAESRVSDSTDPQFEESNRLLVEALEEQKQQHKRTLHKWLKEGTHVAPHGKGFRLTLELTEIDWFLQVLNDVRVGAWATLGRPRPGDDKPIQVDDDTLPYFVAMEMGGYFQNFILGALECAPSEAEAEDESEPGAPEDDE